MFLYIFFLLSFCSLLLSPFFLYHLLCLFHLISFSISPVYIFTLKYNTQNILSYMENEKLPPLPLSPGRFGKVGLLNFSFTKPSLFLSLASLSLSLFLAYSLSFYCFLEVRPTLLLILLEYLSLSLFLPIYLSFSLAFFLSFLLVFGGEATPSYPPRIPIRRPNRVSLWLKNFQFQVG